MKQRFFFCFGLSSDLSCSSGVGSAFSDTEADIKKVSKNSAEKKVCLSPFKSYNNLKPMLYILLQLPYLKYIGLSAVIGTPSF